MSEETPDSGDETVGTERELGQLKTGLDTDRQPGAASTDGDGGGEVHGELGTVVARGILTKTTVTPADKIQLDDRTRVAELTEDMISLMKTVSKLESTVIPELKSKIIRLTKYVEQFHPRPPRSCSACGRTLMPHEKGTKHVSCTNTPNR